MCTRSDQKSTPTADMYTLESCCLLRVVDGELSMHDQLRDLALAIAADRPTAERTHVHGSDALALLREHSKVRATTLD